MVISTLPQALLRFKSFLKINAENKNRSGDGSENVGFDLSTKRNQDISATRDGLLLWWIIIKMKQANREEEDPNKDYIFSPNSNGAFETAHGEAISPELYILPLS